MKASTTLIESITAIQAAHTTQVEARHKAYALYIEACNEANAAAQKACEKANAKLEKAYRAAAKKNKAEEEKANELYVSGIIDEKLTLHATADVERLTDNVINRNDCKSK